MTAKPKTKRGGARAGAGVMKTGVNKKPVCIRMSLDIVEWLATVESKTATIEAALRAQMKKGAK